MSDKLLFHNNICSCFKSSHRTVQYWLNSIKSCKKFSFLDGGSFKNLYINSDIWRNFQYTSEIYIQCTYIAHLTSMFIATGEKLTHSTMLWGGKTLVICYDLYSIATYAIYKAQIALFLWIHLGYVYTNWTGVKKPLSYFMSFWFCVQET